MIIRKINFESHPILGNLELDFTKPDGSIHDTIVFVGENGNGKTTILKWISDIKKLHYVNAKIDYGFYLECITYKPYKTCSHPQPNVVMTMRNTLDNKKHFIIEPEKDSAGNKISIPFSTLYCQSASGIYPEAIRTVTNIGNSKFDNREQDKDLATFVKQLIINYDSEDADDILNWVRSNPDLIPPEKIIEPRIKKLRAFIEPIFDNIHYKKIITHNKAVNGFDEVVKDVVFSKDEKDILLDDMASGEKQVIFRIVSLLHNLRVYNTTNTNTEITLAIDEPEISIHPKWQSKTFESYQRVAQLKGAQLFIATHSEHIIKSALDSDSLIVILTKSAQGEICAKNLNDLKLQSKNNLFVPTYAQIVYEVFGIPTGEFHNELYQYIESESGKKFDEALPNDFPVNRERKTADGATWGNRKISMPSYIRHQYNHPNSNNSYSEQELIGSIESMKAVIIQQKI